MTEKKLSDYLHFYKGCQVQTPTRHYSSDGGKSFKLVGTLMEIDWVINQVGLHFPENDIHDLNSYPIEVVKPILRRLSSMTEEEAVVYLKMKYNAVDNISIDSKNENGFWFKLHGITKLKFIFYGEIKDTSYPEQFAWLIRQGFWLFGDDWFTEGLIIDADTVK